MRILERYFEALRAQDWEGLAACLAEDVHRTGPYLDSIRGRQAYLDFLAGLIPSLRGYELKVFRTRRLEDGSALVELSETVERDGVRTEFPEAIVFDFNDSGRIQRLDIYLKQPPERGLRRDASPRAGSGSLQGRASKEKPWPTRSDLTV